MRKVSETVGFPTGDRCTRSDQGDPQIAETLEIEAAERYLDLLIEKSLDVIARLAASHAGRSCDGTCSESAELRAIVKELEGLRCGFATAFAFCVADPDR